MDELEYAAPLWVRGAAAATCLAGGVSIAVLFGWGLGDPTWSISSGIGALFAAAVFEVRRREGGQGGRDEWRLYCRNERVRE